MMRRHQTPKAVYVHIPFCTNKCHYCDFNSYVLKGRPVMDYLDALEREMERTVRAVPPGEIETIFVGGEPRRYCRWIRWRASCAG